MSVQFILGTSGTGKTTYCIEQIVRALSEGSDANLLYLVPEQATYQAQRAILSATDITGYSRIRVLSFDRISFLLSGRNTARPALSRLGRQMVIGKLLAENTDRLSVFGRSAGTPGLSIHMAQIISELAAWAKQPEDVYELVEQLKQNNNTSTAMKFDDIRLIYEQYLESIGERFRDPDIEAIKACGKVSDADFIKSAMLWVDGFSGFTAGEQAMLKALVKQTDQTQIAICLDPSRLNTDGWDIAGDATTSIFSSTETTYQTLLQMIRDMKLKLIEPILLDRAKRFSNAALAHIERSFIHKKEKQISCGDHVQVVSAAGKRQEVHYIAKQIDQLVREQGYRYRDIAVIATDISQYEPYVEAIFEDLGIPYFIDKAKQLSNHRVASLLSSALASIQGNFATSDVLAYLKSDPGYIGQLDLALLENYCFAFGIKGSDWLSGKKWEFDDKAQPDFDEDRINIARNTAVGPLIQLADELKNSADDNGLLTVEEIIKLVFAFAENTGVWDRLRLEVKKSKEANDTETALENLQFYDRLMDIFDEMCEVFGDNPMTISDFSQILNSAMSQLAMAFIPPSLDQVLTGSIERSRHPDLKAVFLAGTTQKQFPIPLNFTGLLTDIDRRSALAGQFELPGGLSTNLLERQYLAYIAFTRAGHLLFVSYPAVDEKGKILVRSGFVDWLESLFTDLNEQKASMYTPLDQACNIYEVRDILCEAVGKACDSSRTDDDVTKKNVITKTGNDDTGKSLGIVTVPGTKRWIETVLKEAEADNGLKNAAKTAISAATYENKAKLCETTARHIFPNELNCSASRLSCFAQCPYKYFSKYVLQLQRRKQFKLEPLDIGRFYHAVLERVANNLQQDNVDITQMTDKQIADLVHRQAQIQIDSDNFLQNFASHSTHNDFILTSACDVLCECVKDISKMTGAGIFKPQLAEVSFGLNGDLDIGSLDIMLESGQLLKFRGKIDRIDTARVDGSNIAVIFDYKTSGQKFDWGQFYNGLDMQLVIYILALDNAKDKLDIDSVAGAFFMPIEAAKQAVSPEKINSDEKFQRKAVGIFNGDIFRALEVKADKNSRYYNFYVTKDGQPYGNYQKSGALRNQDFENVTRLGFDMIKKLGQQIASGQIEATPFRKANKSPCGNCEYKALCRFDWQVNEYKNIESPDKQKVLEIANQLYCQTKTNNDQ